MNMAMCKTDNIVKTDSHNVKKDEIDLTIENTKFN